ncbi:hypothetical protein ACWEQL_31040 [Kitasatospora sp. NPDC004240]
MLFLSACSAGDGGSSVDRLGSAAPGVPGVGAPAVPGGSAGGGTVPADGPEGAAGRVVLATYQDWWKAQTEAFGRPDSDGGALETYSSGNALRGSLVNLRQLHDSHLVMIGSPRNSPVLKALDLKADPRTAVIEDCLDVSGWHQADATTRAVKDPEKRLTRYIVTASLRMFEARWLIYDFKREVDRTC